MKLPKNSFMEVNVSKSLALKIKGLGSITHIEIGVKVFEKQCKVKSQGSSIYQHVPQPRPKMKDMLHILDIIKLHKEESMTTWIDIASSHGKGFQT